MVNQIISIEADKKRELLVSKLQAELGQNFFDYTMHDINDSLTSILALCDMSKMGDIPRVKGHIQRVNELLQNLKVYQVSTTFNVNHVLKNTMGLFRKYFKKDVYLSHSFSVKRALSNMDRHTLEIGLIEVMVEMALLSDSEEDIRHISLELCQWGKFGQIILTHKNFHAPSDARVRLVEVAQRFSSSVEVTVKGVDTELSMLIPLHFSRDFGIARTKESGRTKNSAQME